MSAQAESVEQELEAALPNMLDVLAWEIELAGARCLKLDSLIGELMPVLPDEQRARMMEGMHMVDLLGQHLTSLSAFARRMSEKVPDTVSAPVGAAIEEMTLSALADRMFTALGGEEKGVNDFHDAGDFDLF